MEFFSIIVPVYNRPEEVEELLQSLLRQTETNFEVILVEDGSQLDCQKIAAGYKELLSISYYFKPNSGPGPSRNYGAERAKGTYLVFLDSDCVLPETYIHALNEFMNREKADCFGGPDRAHSSFTPIQKAISYSMTSFYTTGGIRGGNKKVIKFHPRSFNMGFSKKVFEVTQGFAPIRFGEDIDLSLRIEAAGFKMVLISEAWVYHKRRTDFKKFYKQIYNSGIARINLYKRHPASLKLTHFFPAVFVTALVCSCLVALFFHNFFFLGCFFFYLLLILADAALLNKSLQIGLLAVVATMVQMFSYGLGFLKAFFLRVILGRGEFEAFKKNFYR